MSIKSRPIHSQPAPLAAAASLLATMFSFACGAEPWLEFEGQSGPGKGKHIVLISGDEEYRSEEALPMLAKILSRHHGFRCTVLFAIEPRTGFVDPTFQENLPGLHTLADADLMIIATRFRTPTAEQQKWVERYLNAGKPVLGLRTATHAFRGELEYFGLHVLGEEWVAHHGGHKVEGCRGVVEREHAGHPILRGVGEIFVPSDVYSVIHLHPADTILLRGAVTESLEPESQNVVGEKNEPMMPLAWLRKYASPDGSTTGRAFCTTAGASTDFLDPDLRRLVVNAAYHLVELDIPQVANVDVIDTYTPSFYGFFKEEGYWLTRQIVPSDFGWGKTPEPVDPPGTPESYWTRNR